MADYISKFPAAEIDARLEKMVNVTYEELVALRDDSKLIPGQKYRMIDYETMTSQEGTQSAGHPFDLILTALDEKTLDEKCSAIQSERDIDGYFANSNLVAWDVRYCLDNDKNRFNWAVVPGKTITVDLSIMNTGIVSAQLNGTFVYKDITYARWDTNIQGMACYILTPSEDVVVGDKPIMYIVDYSSGTTIGTITSFNEVTTIGKGVIYRLIDSVQNDCAYDFKNIMFTRKLTDGVYDVEAGVDTFVYTFNSYNTDGSHSDYSEVNPPMCFKNSIQLNGSLYDNVFLNSGLALCYNNTLGFNCINNTFGNHCYDNTLVDNCTNNVFIGYCSDNTLKSTCSNNVFENHCIRNILGDRCGSNTFGENCTDNTLGRANLRNILGDICERNVFGEECNDNSLGALCKRNIFQSCTRITLGQMCEENIFYGTCSSITLGAGCDNNIFGGNCVNNIIGQNCTYNDFGCGFRDNNLGDTCSYNIFKNYCISNTFGLGCGNNNLDSCQGNNFGINCDNNVFYSCSNNTLGDHCSGNIFKLNCNSNTFGNYCSYNTLEYNCSYNVFGDTTAEASNCSNIHLKDCRYIKLNLSDTLYSTKNYTISCVFGDSSSLREIILEGNRAYETFITAKEDGSIVEYTIDDIINA